MKRTGWVLNLAVAVAAAAGASAYWKLDGCSCREAQASTAAVFSTQTPGVADQCILKVDGMTCGGCVRDVRESLERVDGVKAARVDLKRGEATVAFDLSRVKPEALAKAVEKAGYGCRVEPPRPPAGSPPKGVEGPR